MRREHSEQQDQQDQQQSEPFEFVPAEVARESPLDVDRPGLMHRWRAALADAGRTDDGALAQIVK